MSSYHEPLSKSPKASKTPITGYMHSTLISSIGAPKSCDIVGESGKNNRHFFCADCGSSLFTELDVMDDKTVIKAGTLDHGEANLREKVNLEFYVKDRVPYLGAVPDAKQELRLG